jgi:hypothetical protein
MSHTDIDVVTHLFLALYPAAALFGVEMIYKFTKFEQWIKYIVQGFVCIAFAIAFITLIDATGIALMLFILAPALFVQARRVKNQS